ncbi:MAG: aspartate kinase [Alphaproteobacteria bacterium CG_4_10_14_0_2_um_filter_63_37]|nr:MAG: aspartate kinase [Proteobacteria bacterium CG1_02_64_396]PJA24800.1 MAG: aspartate kinase [Alphaproteobacteria bacterium CG_4_10_14_0_2_um_filter_63_37]
MALIVAKFGGTSVADPERIKNVAAILQAVRQNGDQVVAVVSAMSGETNRLLGFVAQMGERPSPQEADVVVSTGEQVTIGLLALALQARGVPARSFTGGQVKIVTDTAHSRARILAIDDAALRTALAAGEIPVVAGFQGVSEGGRITTLGRGGSDTTGVALAVALGADRCDIYTDVDGVYTTDPRIESKATRIDKIAFEEMLEMASLGAKVLQIRSVEFAHKYGMPVRVRSTFKPEDEGSLVCPEDPSMERALVTAIAFNRDEAKLTLQGVPDRPGIAAAIFAPIAAAGINVDMIIQNVSDHGATDMTFTVPEADFKQAKGLLEQVAEQVGARGVSGDTDVAKVSAVGVGMRSHTGVASHMFQVLSNEGVNIQMISTSEIKISVVVARKYLELAVRVLHEAFELHMPAEERTGL